MNIIINVLKKSGIALAIVFCITAVGPIAHAADLDFGGDFGGWETDFYQDYETPEYDYDYGGDEYGGWETDYYQDYDYGNEDYGGWETDYYQDYDAYDYDEESYQDLSSQGSSSKMPSFMQSFMKPSSYSTPSYKPAPYYVYPPAKPQPNKPSKSQPTEICTHNSCNVTNNTNVNQNIVGSFNQPYAMYDEFYSHFEYEYDICYNLPGYQEYVPQGYYIEGGNCFYQEYYQEYTPYVSLSAVPYTGFELGPVGTALYWAFVVAWCALAAYLIAVKKVQNKIVKGLSNFLYPAVAPASTPAPTLRAEAPAISQAPVAKSEGGIDPFIAEQLSKYR